jgi:23S rRNA pseudouridine1911/1915/1917 synthase
MTSSATMVTSPTIITTVSVVTSRLRKRISGGVPGSGASDMTANLSVLRVVIGDDPPARLDKALARDVPEAAALSRSRLARLIAEGAVSRAARP